PGGTERAHHPRPDPQAPRRRRAGLLRPTRNQQRTDRGDQRPPRTPTRHRPGLPQPHQLHRPQPPRDRRPQTPTTPSSAMGPQSSIISLNRATTPLANIRGTLTSSQGSREVSLEIALPPSPT